MQTKVVGWSVHVEPQTPWYSDQDYEGSDRQKRDCEEIVQAIKRHVDLLGHVATKCHRIDVCEFCGRTWTECSQSPHNGGCCDEDAGLMPEE